MGTQSSPKKDAGTRLDYDVPSVWPRNLPPVNLDSKEKKKINDCFNGLVPSEGFHEKFAHALSGFIWDVKVVQKATPAKVSERLKGGVQLHAHRLFDAINQLESTDHGIIDREFTRNLLAERPSVSVNRFRSQLKLFVQHTDAAVRSLEATPKRGRMPAYAEQVLSFNVDFAIYEEKGSYSSCYKDGLFANLLLVALSIGDKRLKRRIGKHRTDVTDLMRHAKLQRSEVPQ